MKVIDKYRDRLINNELEVGGFNYLNNIYKEKLTKNVKVTTFSKLYVSVIVGLYEDGLMPELKQQHIDYLKKYLDDSSNTEMPFTEERQIHPNSYYGHLYNKNKSYVWMVTAYMHHIYTDLLEKYTDDVLYIDTDAIFHLNDLELDFIDVEYETYTLDNLILVAKKRYIANSTDDENLPSYQKNNLIDGVIVRGYTEKRIDRVTTFMNEIKKEMRDNKIETLLD